MSASPDPISLFSRAQEIESDEERARFLDQACAGDAALRAEVESLLKHGSTADFLDQPLIASTPLIEGVGTMIGPYKLLQRIGEGGMGVVFMAEQEKPVRRKVALKVIKPGMDTAQVIARFEAERQALAMMEHSNIARVLDVGATDTGRPFFVMELVKGVPITEYCDRNHLTPKERLELFIPVCRAIQHAHQKGIIHRDVKPSNVLVTLHDGHPIPKVIDFGVAKAIDQRLTEKTMFTEFGAIIGTLEYMSPEQAEMGALDIDTRSDIYSLGVMLYELLTGSTPLERAKLRQAAYSEILRRIREEEPVKPSTRLSESKDALPSISAQRKMEPARLTRLVRGDLDWIVMKSLEKDRTRRYETATGFARDIQRYLDGDAVEACPPSASYKLRKFARKHRTALATAGAFGLLLVAATAVSVDLAYWANRERNRALDREQMAIDAVRRYGDVVRETPELKNDPSLAPLRTKLLKEPQEFFKKLRDRLQSNHETTPDSFARLATASSALGKLTNEIGDKREALRAFEESLSIFERLARENPKVMKYQVELAAIDHYMGVQLSEIGQKAGALESYQRALAICDRLARENPSVQSYQYDLASNHNSIGILQHNTGRFSEALESYDRAREIYERLVRENPSIPDYQRALASIHDNIGTMRSKLGRRAEAMESFRWSLAIRERLARENPSVAEYQHNLAGSLFNIGGFQGGTDRPEKALESFERARAIYERLASENPSVTLYRDNLAKTHNRIGLKRSEMGRLVEALESHEQARAIRERLTRENPSVPEYQDDLATTYNNIGILLLETGRSAEALEFYERARVIFARLTREYPSIPGYWSVLASITNNIANQLGQMGRSAEALESHKQALTIRERLVREYPLVTEYQRDLAASHNNIANQQGERGQLAEALESYGRAVAIYERLASDNPSAAEYQHTLASFLYNIGGLQVQPEKAMESYERARAIHERLARDNPAVPLYRHKLARTLNRIGLKLNETGHRVEALAAHDRAREIRERLVRENPSVTEYQKDLGDTYLNIGVQYNESGRSAEALGSYEQARAIYERLAIENPSDPNYQNVLAISHNNIGGQFSDTGRNAEALESYERARAIYERLVREHPESPDFACYMGVTIDNMANVDLNQKQFNEARVKVMRAIEWQRKALAVSPNHPTYRRFLANHLTHLIQAVEGLGLADEADKARRERADLAASDPIKAALDARLATVLKGQAPKDDAERLSLAYRAYEKALHASASRLFAEALANDPKLADSRQTQHAYNAACAAALAGCGRGKDEPPLDDAAKAKFRRQALDWLKSELLAWRGVELTTGPGTKEIVGKALKHWMEDTDLLGIRDQKELSKLPEEEHAAFQRLWSDVDQLLSKASPK